jgi:hypothetical protein
MKDRTAFQVPTGQRQLFLDGLGIADLNGVEKTMHQPEKRGAVLKPDIPSDGFRLTLRGRSVCSHFVIA